MQEWGCTCYFDGLGRGTDFKGKVYPCDLIDADFHILLDSFLESLLLSADRIGSNTQQVSCKVAVRVAAHRCGLIRSHAGDGDVRICDPSPCLVGDGAYDGAAVHLRDCNCRQRKGQNQKDENGDQVASTQHWALPGIAAKQTTNLCEAIGYTSEEVMSSMSIAKTQSHVCSE